MMQYSGDGSSSGFFLAIFRIFGARYWRGGGVLPARARAVGVVRVDRVVV